MHPDVVLSVAFSRDARHIVSDGADGLVRVWDAASGSPVGEPMQGHRSAVSSVAFRPDGRLVSGGNDQSLRVWDIPLSWTDALCTKLTRNMSRKEWREWVSGEIGYRCQCSGLPIPADDGAISPTSPTCEVAR